MESTAQHSLTKYQVKVMKKIVECPDGFFRHPRGGNCELAILELLSAGLIEYTDEDNDWHAKNLTVSGKAALVAAIG